MQPNGPDITEEEIAWLWDATRPLAEDMHRRLRQAATQRVSGGSMRTGLRDLSPEQRARRAALIIGGSTMIASTLLRFERLYLRSLGGGEDAERLLTEGLAAIECAAEAPADGE